MKIYINRTHCDACQSFCDRHVAKFIRFPDGGEDLPCVQSIEEDGADVWTLVVTDEDKVTTLVLDEAQRKIAGLEGLSDFLK